MYSPSPFCERAAIPACAKQTFVIASGLLQLAADRRHNLQHFLSEQAALLAEQVSD